jgi:cytochrome c553
MKKMNKTPLAAAMGAAIISSLGGMPANAETNPFSMTQLSSGYMQLAEGEMKCGANMGGMAKPLSKTEIRDIAAYLSSLPGSLVNRK